MSKSQFFSKVRCSSHRKRILEISQKVKSLHIQDRIETGVLKAIISENLVGKKYNNKIFFYNLKKTFLNSYDS